MIQPADNADQWVPQGVIVTKLAPPRLHRAPVPRERLAADATASVTVIVAPAGMGKTTLLRQWFDAQCDAGVHTGWLTADPFDTDSERFLAHCIAALAPAGAQARHRIAVAIAAGRIQAALAFWINAMNAEARPTALFVDDLHRAGSAGTWASLNRLIDVAPPRMRFFLASRRELPLPCARLRVTDRLREVGATQLAFTDAECCHFLKQTHGIDMADAQATRLNCAVEGWVAALQLAALSGRYPGPAANSDAMLAAGRADIFEFLACEVIDAQDASMRAFLLDTSILERLSAPLCDAVRESRDSDALLLRAERAGLFLLRLDGGHAWYRYHQLFAAFMRSYLGREDPLRLQQLHERAAQWLRSSGQFLDAVPHALAAGQYEAAADMIESVGLDMLESESTTTLGQWLAALPPELLSNRLALCVLSAWRHVVAMDFPAAEACRRDAERLARRRDAKAPARADGLLSDLPLLAATIDYMRRGSPGAGAERLRPYSLPVMGHLARSRSLILSAYDARARGDLERAVALFDTAAEASLEAASPWSYQYAVLQLGYLHYQRADFAASERAYRNGIAYARQSGDEPSPTGLFLSAALAMLHVETMDLASAADALAAPLEALRVSGNDGVYGVALIEAARLSLANRRFAQAAAQLTRAKALLDHGDDRRNWFRANALDIRCALASSDDRRASRLVEAFGSENNGSGARDGPLPEMVELAGIATLAVLNQARQHQEVVRSATALGSSARTAGRRLHEIEAQVQEAIAWQSLGDVARAAVMIERVVRLASARRVVWPFVNRGPALDLLLGQALDKFSAPGDPGRALLEVALGRAQADAGTATPDDGVLVSGLLYPRERQALQFAAAGLSNSQIAERMTLSAETIKWYLRQAYQKLQVRNRTHAVTRARALKLID